MVAKSGTLSYETVGALTRANLGQSLCIGMGGDIIAGTNLVESLQMFEKDEETEAVVLVGEVGGRAEQDAAEWINEYRRRASNPKYGDISGEDDAETLIRCADQSLVWWEVSKLHQRGSWVMQGLLLPFERILQKSNAMP